MDKKEFRVLIKYCFLKGKIQLKQKFGTAPGKSTIKDWYAKFRLGEMNTEDGERSGHPKEVAAEENIKKIHKMILIERKLKLNEIADTIKISTERVHHIIHEYVGMRMLCAKWVPREHIFDQKQRRVDDLEQCLKMIKHNKPEFLRRYVTMDETWLHHFTPKSNRQLSEWTAHDEPAPNEWYATVSWQGYSVCIWDTHGIIFIDYLGKGRTINSDYYIALWDRLKDEIAEKRPHLKKKKVLLQNRSNQK
ncbi:hypothetical protein GWI33_014920 [Rhynchophorus ferrugineus]|uniref:Transposase n=1 Tax=Rhynchophorus ferrugineus TaxID=354439 RepID=A0A834M8M3_RHYFE|nr:hypothetical protein GWI33_014920 [Rhynchophorus ferrugineus]